MTRVWTEYIAERKVSIVFTPGNTTVHRTNIPDSCRLPRELQEFVRERRLQRRRMVAKDVAVFLRSKRCLDYNPECSVLSTFAMQCVQPFLPKQISRHGEKKVSQNYRLKQIILPKQDQYIRHVMEEKDKGRRRMEYMDESYVPHHYLWHKDFLYDLTDE